MLMMMMLGVELRIGLLYQLQMIMVMTDEYGAVA
jgi:hypothetical protein